MLPPVRLVFLHWNGYSECVPAAEWGLICSPNGKPALRSLLKPCCADSKAPIEVILSEPGIFKKSY